MPWGLPVPFERADSVGESRGIAYNQSKGTMAATEFMSQCKFGRTERLAVRARVLAAGAASQNEDHCSKAHHGEFRYSVDHFWRTAVADWNSLGHNAGIPIR